MARIIFFVIFAVTVMPGVLFAEQTTSSDRFGMLHLYKPSRQIDYAVVLFSDSDGWSPEIDRFAQFVSNDGVFVVGIDSRDYLSHLNVDSNDCVYLAGEVERLSQSSQNSLKLPNYIKPWLMGYGQGSSLAYAVVAQAKEAYEGLIGLSFCPELVLAKPLCEGESITATYNSKSKTNILQSIVNSQANLHVFNSKESKCTSSENPTFLTQLDETNDRLLSKESWHKYFLPIIKNVSSVSDEHALDSVVDLPLVPLASLVPPTTDYFVVFLSGDGGWATIDKTIGNDLVKKGVNVVGVDSLKYFWTEKSVEQATKDISRVIKAYSRAWGQSHVLLVGFSLGADVLPFIYNRLDAKLQKQVVSVALLSPSLNADFEVHISDWIGFHSSSAGLPLQPEVEKITKTNIVCIYGTEDDDGVCEKVDPKKVEIHAMPGDHHFDGDYESISKILMSAARKNIS